MERVDFAEARQIARNALAQRLTEEHGPELAERIMAARGDAGIDAIATQVQARHNEAVARQEYESARQAELGQKRSRMTPAQKAAFVDKHGVEAFRKLAAV